MSVMDFKLKCRVGKGACSGCPVFARNPSSSRVEGFAWAGKCRAPSVGEKRSGGPHDLKTELDNFPPKGILMPLFADLLFPFFLEGLPLR